MADAIEDATTLMTDLSVAVRRVFNSTIETTALATASLSASSLT